MFSIKWNFLQIENSFWNFFVDGEECVVGCCSCKSNCYCEIIGWMTSFIGCFRQGWINWCKYLLYLTFVSILGWKFTTTSRNMWLSRKCDSVFIRTTRESNYSRKGINIQSCFKMSHLLATRMERKLVILQLRMEM